MRALVLVLALLAKPLQAEITRSAEILAAFEQWMTAEGVTEASIALAAQGEKPVKNGYGRPADAPVTLASLSKAITGACIAVLQQEGVFDLNAPIADLLPLPGAKGVLADHLSQTSGLTPDRTQGRPWHLEENRSPRHAEAATRAFAGQQGAKAFAYNNENYAVLGAVIDATGMAGYETDCRQLVLEPLGITTAAMDPVWGPHGAWGGWSMPVGDYARFISEWFGSPRNIGRDPLSWPHAELGQDRYYVMGAFHRRRRGANLFWHAGQLCWDGEGASSYFASYGGDPVVVVGVPACLSQSAFAALDKALFEAALR